MIVLGDVSGIQDYVFGVSEVGGGQARRLRARSFLVQAMSECAAVRMLEMLGWPIAKSHYLYGGAGKFILRGDADPDRGTGLADQLNADLLRETAGELRLAIAVGTGGDEVAAYRSAQQQLQRVKAAPYRPPARWNPARLVLAPLDTPCRLCRRSRATQVEREPETGESYPICDGCACSLRLGRQLPRAQAMVLRQGAGDFTWFGLGGTLSAEVGPKTDEEAVALVRLDGRPEAPPGWSAQRFLSRRLMTRIPLDSRGDPVWFVELAERTKGDRLLAVLKADVDGLGVEIERRLHARADLGDFLDFADLLDQFFTEALHLEIEREPRWRDSIYTVFAGGDDLVMIGPWDVMFEFAARVRQLFAEQFPQLGLSAGLSLFKPKRPVKTAIEDAQRLLDLAKTGPKDQLAALGQVWSWKQHPFIESEAQRLATWTRQALMQRGWLHTLLELVEARHGSNPDPLATARLAYHVTRNYRDSAVRAWASQLIHDFDDETIPRVRYLPAILRHALTATRKASEREE